MDVRNPSAETTMASRTPLRIGCLGLAVHDIERCVAFYREAIGLDLMRREDAHAVLGVAGVPLLHLEWRPGALPDDKREAGMFHVAFAMPTRGHLADWYAHALRIGLVITRTGDHLINEAIYFDDPEGNGCECYADRPPETWTWYADGTRAIQMGQPIDIEGLVAEAGLATEAWHAPSGLRVGHINLRVGDVVAAERFWCEAIGLDHVGRRTIERHGRPATMAFMSSGHYHHHVAVNDFTSPEAGPRDPDRAGLSWFVIETESAAELEAVRQRLTAAGVVVSPTEGGFETVDPWGSRVRIVAA